MKTIHAAQNGPIRHALSRLAGRRTWRLVLVAALLFGAGILFAAKPYSSAHAATGFSGDISFDQYTASSGYKNVVSSEVTASVRALLYDNNPEVNFGDGTTLEGLRNWDGCSTSMCPTLYASHFYAAPGTYTVTISYDGPTGITYSTSNTVPVQPTYVTFNFQITGSGSGSVSYYWLGMRYDTNHLGFDGSTGSGSCAVTCSLTLKAGTKVFLTAHPAAGSTFAGWGDDIASLCTAGQSARSCSKEYQITPPTSGSTWTFLVPQVWTSSNQPYSQNVYLTFNR